MSGCEAKRIFVRFYFSLKALCNISNVASLSCRSNSNRCCLSCRSSSYRRSRSTFSAWSCSLRRASSSRRRANSSCFRESRTLDFSFPFPVRLGSAPDFGFFLWGGTAVGIQHGGFKIESIFKGEISGRKFLRPTVRRRRSGFLR